MRGRTTKEKDERKNYKGERWEEELQRRKMRGRTTKKDERKNCKGER